MDKIHEDIKELRKLRRFSNTLVEMAAYLGVEEKTSLTDIMFLISLMAEKSENIWKNNPTIKTIGNKLIRITDLELPVQQMTLGRFIKELEAIPKDKMINKFCEPHSYRGYYSDLAFEKKEGKQTVETLLMICKNCLMTVFTGWKGGEFEMNENTPLWIAKYGSNGVKIMGIIERKKVWLLTQQEDKL